MNLRKNVKFSKLFHDTVYCSLFNGGFKKKFLRLKHIIKYERYCNKPSYEFIISQSKPVKLKISPSSYLQSHIDLLREEMW